MSEVKAGSGVDHEGAPLRSANQQQAPVLSRDASGVAHYAIRSVRDSLAVPEDRIDECLREFKIMLDMARAAVGLMDAVSDEMIGHGEVRWRMGEMFEWIDDGLGVANVHLRATDPAAGSVVLAVDQRPEGAPSRSTPEVPNAR